jgi:Leucine-rich repeat (LRR) protein
MKLRLGLIALLVPIAVAHASTGGTGTIGSAQEQALSDRDALVVLYQATGGPNWTQNTNWLSDKPIGEWHGVSTDRRGRVRSLDLSSNNLTGSLPPELGSLATLTSLGLYNNQLSGEIPPELGNLTNLTWLGLYNNQLSGEIPSELGGLTNLETLDLNSNQLTGEIPPDLGGLANLTGLWLYNNQLSGGIPRKLGGLTNLTWLGLHENQLSGGIPRKLGGLTNLTWLGLHENQLSGGIPRQLGSLTNLETLNLNSNQLTGEIPPDLGSLANLTWLRLYNNQLSGEIPPALGRLTNLETLGLEKNQLTGEIPSALGSLSNLTWLNLHTNQLGGEIPPALGNLANLTHLYLGNNQLTLCLPDALHALRLVLETDVDHLPDCGAGGQEVILTVNDDPLLYNNVFVLPVSYDFRSGPPQLDEHARTFFSYFEGVFDFLILAHNLHWYSYITESYNFDYGGRFVTVKNQIRGTGERHYYRNSGWGSSGKLQGVSEIVTVDDLVGNLALHEIAHRWGNFVVPIEGELESGAPIGNHWGFSSANGTLGGFDPADLVDHGDGRYSAGYFSTTGHGPKPYSPIELYLAGLIPPEEVPDLWVAEDGAWLDEYAEDGDRIFTASKIRTYTIEDIINEHGERVPDHTRSQRDFRAAAILLIDENHPLYPWQLERASRNFAQFSHAGPDEVIDYNFYEATGGRATMAMGDLSRFLKSAGATSVPGAPAGPTVTGDLRAGIEFSWSEPASVGGLTVTSYDLRYRPTSDGSSWIAVEKIWEIGGGDLQHTLTGLAGGGEHDLQVRAVNGAGAGPWSDTVIGTARAWAHCLKGDIAKGFSLVVYAGGAIEELAACAESREVAALYTLHEGAYVLYVPGAPDFVNQRFAELYPDGVPPLTALVAGSSGPPSEDPAGDVGRLPSGSQCLHGEIAEGFSLVLYEGGVVEELGACAQSLNVTEVYTLADGEWVSYTPGAPESANQAFVELFADGVPAITPLVARGGAPPEAASGRDVEASN